MTRWLAAPRAGPAADEAIGRVLAGALATAGYGTALGVVRAAIESGKQVDVFSDETRPFLQGARLTVWELQRDGIAATNPRWPAGGCLFYGRFYDSC
jgi:hypothetical protein